MKRYIGAMTSNRKLQKPRSGDPCLCGSGQKFGKCCRDNLPGLDMFERWKEPARKKQWPAVRRAVRADVTQYTIYHRSNTVPLMRSGSPAASRVLQVDINALNAAVEHLAHAYAQLSQLEAFPAALERLRANIEHPHWHRKITFQQAMTAHLIDHEDVARAELAKLGPINAREQDFGVLSLHLDLNADSLSFLEKLPLYDRAITLSEGRSARIQYATAKAMELLLAGEAATARTALHETLSLVRDEEEEQELGPVCESWVCKLLEICGVVFKDPALFEEAATRLTRLLDTEGQWAPAGRGHLYRCLGDVLRQNEHWSEAAEAYSLGYAADGDDGHRIFEATCLLMQGEPHAGLALLENIDFEALGLPEQADFAIAYAAVAIRLAEAAPLEHASRLLHQIKPLRQFFALQNAEYRAAVERAKADLSAVASTGRLSWLHKALGTFSRYVMVQPNIAGIGLNLNAAIDDAIAPRSTKNTPDDERAR